MARAGRPESNAPAASDIAEQLASAGLVRLVAAADGDGLAAAGLLARRLDASEIPYQVSVTPLPAAGKRTTDADLTLALGRPVGDADLTLGLGAPASQAAYETASHLGDATAPLALAGMVAGGFVPQGTALDDAETTRRPGIAVPTADLVDGLAHSTLVHAPFSGRPDAAEGLLPERARDPTEETHRAAASAVALAVAGDEAGTVRGARRIERLLRPYIAGPLVTVGGYADVLDALARSDPGVGVALALGQADVDAGLATWRDHAERAHDGVRNATTGRYDGLFVARCDADAPAGTVARLVRDFRSPEPAVLVVTDGTAVALATDETDIGQVLRDAATSVDGTGDGTETTARAHYDVADTEFVAAVREAQ